MKRLLLVAGCLLALSQGIIAQQAGNVWDLRRCIEHALEQNLQVFQANLTTTDRELLLEQAKNNRLPNLSGNANGSGNFGYVNDPFTNQFSTASIYSSNVSLNSNVSLFSGFQLRDNIRQSTADLQASRMDEEQMRNDIMLRVTQAYLNILLSQELLDNARIQLGVTNERRSQTEKRVDAGALAPAALLDIESQQATEELAMLNAENQLELAYLTLQQLLMLDPDESFSVVKPAFLAPPALDLPASGDIYHTALDIQPNIRAAVFRITSADYAIAQAKGRRLPTLGMQGGFFTGYSSIRRQATGQFNQVGTPVDVEFGGVAQTITIFNRVPVLGKYGFVDQLSDQLSLSLGLGMSIPIFNRGQISNAIQRAELARKNAELNLEQQKQNLKQAVEQAYQNAKAGYATWRATEKQVRALNMAFENAEKQYGLGLLNSLDYLLAKNNLTRAQNDLTRTKYEAIFRAKILDFYQGKPITIEE